MPYQIMDAATVGKYPDPIPDTSRKSLTYIPIKKTSGWSELSLLKRYITSKAALGFYSLPSPDADGRSYHDRIKVMYVPYGFCLLCMSSEGLGLYCYCCIKTAERQCL